MASDLQPRRETSQLVSGGTMTRRNRTILFSAGLAIALAACHPNTPTTSVSALSYQVQSNGQRASAPIATDTAGAPAPASRDAAPAQISPNDPLRLLDMP